MVMKLSKLNQLSFLSLMIGAIAFSSCDRQRPDSSEPPIAQSEQQTQVTPNPADSPTATESPIAKASPDAETPDTPASPKINAETMRIEIFHADRQCSELVPESVSVPTRNSLEAAVENVIETTEGEDFKIADYQVNVNQDTGVATVDMRLAPNSRRQFTSLSSCEKLALFSGLDQTLTANKQWNIQEVRFTEKGEEILF
jgi:hypothetical protein